jgi:multidrug efflux pump subunit AcrB
MSLLEFPVRRYQFTLVAFVLFMALGAFAFHSIPRGEDPYFPIPAFIITAVYPGADPIEVERVIAKPIEDRLNELDDVKQLDATISDSVGVVVAEFLPNVDVEKKYDEVVRELNALRPELPVGVTQLEIRKINPGLVNIVQIALVSEEAPYRELEDYARNLKDRLRRLPAIRQAETWAFPARELRVALDLRRMAALGILPGQVIAALESENANIPGGRIEIGSRTFSLRTSGEYADLDEIRRTVVASQRGRSVTVDDLATVSWDNGERNYIGRFDGKRAVFVTANQKDGYNILKTRDEINAVLRDYAEVLPKRIHLERGFDQAQNVSNRLGRLYTDFAIAILLVSVTLLPLGMRAAAIVMVSIPLSIAMGLTALYFSGFSINQISIAGFVVALGLLVDDSVVVVENIARFLREGRTRYEAAIAATRQVFVAIVGCTACLFFAFVPLLFVPSSAGKFIRVLPVSVLATVLASMLVAFTIIPFLASRVLGRHEHPEGNALLRRVKAGIERFYRPWLHRSLAHPRATLVIGAAVVLASFALVPAIGFSLFPKADTPQFMITIESPAGSSLSETGRALDFVEERLRAHPEVAHYFSNLGRTNPKIYYNVIPGAENRDIAELFVQLKSYSTRATPRLYDQLRREFATYPNARIVVKEFENGPPVDSPIAIRILGPELDELEHLAAQVKARIERIQGTRDVYNPLRVARTDLKLRVDSTKAALLGVPTVDLDRTVRLAVSGLPVGKFTETNGEQYDIVVRTPMVDRPTLATLDDLRVPTAAGQTVPLSQLATLEFAKSPIRIQRHKRERAVVISAWTRTGYVTDNVTQSVIADLERMDWPRGYRFEPAGEVEARAESFGDLTSAVLIAGFGILAVLVLEFGSFRSTLIVATVIPLGVAGGLLALLFSGNTLSFTAIIGFIALLGIEIKNSILLVDFTNSLRRQGFALDEAIEKAGEIRFLPILLTSATAIGGLLPLAVQNIGLYSPMAWVIIGGLVTSTLLARLVTPVMYKLLPPEIEVEEGEREFVPVAQQNSQPGNAEPAHLSGDA